jgi:lipoprotein-anchoring transpeptidase ErfK/SrfK
MTASLTRRDFLKLGGAGLLGLFLAELDLRPSSAAAAAQGRVAYSKITSYDAPSREGQKVAEYKRDALLDISAEVTGGAAGDTNRRWYRIGAAEYVYSGGVQPVQTVLNAAVTSLPKSGVVGEVTVPYAESWWGINRRPFRGPRLYYATAHWIAGLTVDDADGRLWYKAYDHLYNAYYYVPAEAVRILPAEELAPLAPDVPEDEKTIEVQLEPQMLLAYEGDRLAFACRVSTGKGEFGTPEGWFTTFHKRPTAHMTGGDDASMYDLTGVPWDTYLTENGIAIHGTFWHNDFGAPRSHGCINLSPADAKRVYRWTRPPVPPGERFLYQPGQGTGVRVIRSASSNSRRVK